MKTGLALREVGTHDGSGKSLIFYNELCREKTKRKTQHSSDIVLNKQDKSSFLVIQVHKEK
jgi:hypothetical protein